MRPCNRFQTPTAISGKRILFQGTLYERACNRFQTPTAISGWTSSVAGIPATEPAIASKHQQRFQGARQRPMPDGFHPAIASKHQQRFQVVAWTRFAALPDPAIASKHQQRFQAGPRRRAGRRVGSLQSLPNTNSDFRQKTKVGRRTDPDPAIASKHQQRFQVRSRQASRTVAFPLQSLPNTNSDFRGRRRKPFSLTSFCGVPRAVGPVNVASRIRACLGSRQIVQVSLFTPRERRFLLWFLQGVTLLPLPSLLQLPLFSPRH